MSDHKLIVVSYDELFERIERLESCITILTTQLTEGKQETVTDDKLLTRKETAAKMRVSYPTLLKYTKKGILKGYRFGSKVYFKEAEANEAMKKICYDL